MAIKNILVAFNGSPSSEGALRAAMLMQKKYDAHVTGILAHEGRHDRFSRKPWVPDNVRAILDAAVHDNEEKIEGRFREIAGDRLSAGKLHWITLSGEPDSTVAQYACMYDVAIVGQHDGLHGNAETDLHPERIALKSGRPVLVAPADLDETAILRPAVLGWDGRRAATRALNDAMLLLETKQRVDVISFGDDVRPPLKGIDVVTALGRHGVPAERIRRPGNGKNFGEELLAYCREVEAGLLVMGAFEHSVFREELFGGTTKHVLKNAHLPVLISH